MPDETTPLTLVVIAKAPVAGTSKTRLCPPCTPEQAAALSEAALRDTLTAVRATPAARRVLVLEGEPGPWMDDGFEVIPQRGEGLDERLASAFEDVGAPAAFLIGMDTPQVTPAMIAAGGAGLLAPGVDAVFGEAEDGGYWAVGLRAPNRRVFEGVPMSRPDTALAQRARFEELGLTWTELPRLRDVDHFEDALAVKASIEGKPSYFVRAMDDIERRRHPVDVRDTGDDMGEPNFKRRTIAALGAWAALIVVAWWWGSWLNATQPDDMLVQAPPLTALFELRLPIGLLAAIALAAAAVALAPKLAARLSWRGLLWAAALLAFAWAFVLAVSGGIDQLAASVRSHLDYLAGVPAIGSNPLTYLQQFTTNIGDYPSHVRSHPPGLVLALWGLGKIGLGSTNTIALGFIAGGALAVPAVLLAVREIASEASARAVAPFLVLAPAAVFIGTSADAFFAGLAAWSVTLLILASRREGRRRDILALAGGTLFALTIFCSYGLALIALVPAIVLWKRRAARVALLALIPVAVMMLLVGWLGFWWFAGLAATREQYLLGIARYRPYGYFVIANLAAFALVLGPATAVGLTRLRDHRLWWLVGGALAAVAIADISGMSKAETERIWLPFAVWVLVACAPLTKSKYVRGWLAIQAGVAVAMQVGVRSPW